MTRIQMTPPILLLLVLRYIENYWFNERVTHGGDIWIRYG
jgi:hypothetical protein